MEQLDDEYDCGDANAEGFEAAFNGECETRNRFPPGTNAHLSWNDGYNSFFELEEDNRKRDATPKTVDPILQQLESMSIEEVASRMGWPVETWPGNCFAVSLKLIEAFGWEGATAVFGHYRGCVSPKCKLFHGRPLVQHGWILTSQGCVVDPTRWVFEASAPKLAVLRPWVDESHAFAEYDEGGEVWARQSRGDAPDFNASEKTFSLLENAPDGLQVYVGCLVARPGKSAVSITEVCQSQLHWLATRPYSDHGAAAGMIYTWLNSLKLIGLVPIDFLRRAEREGVFTA